MRYGANRCRIITIIIIYRFKKKYFSYRITPIVFTMQSECNVVQGPHSNHWLMSFIDFSQCVLLRWWHVLTVLWLYDVLTFLLTYFFGNFWKLYVQGLLRKLVHNWEYKLPYDRKHLQGNQYINSTIIGTLCDLDVCIFLRVVYFCFYLLISSGYKKWQSEGIYEKKD